MMISYAFDKYVKFADYVRQTLENTPISELHYVINKKSFGQSTSLGKLPKPLRRIRARLEKHICNESAMLEECWSDIEVGMLMRKETDE